jgi:hypothetical protein
MTFVQADAWAVWASRWLIGFAVRFPTVDRSCFGLAMKKAEIPM